MKPKNIVFLFTDQQRSDTIEALGNPIIKTPNLNWLVEQGVSFTRAYSPCPVCVPARFSLLTGQLPHRTDCVINETMPEGHPSFMEVLSNHGYQTHGVGKMHFTFAGKPASTLWGFDARDYSEEGGGDDDYKAYLEENGFGHVHDPHGVRSEMYYIPQPSQLPAPLHHTTWVADRSLNFLEQRDQERPFLLMSSFIKPHPPFETPTPWNKLYRGPEMPLPKRPTDSDQLLTFWNRFQNRYKYRDQGTDDNLLRVMKAAYFNAISFIDFQVGRILQYLKENNLLENTIIVYSSDHAELLGDYNCFGKRSFLDSAARIPMLMVDPDLPKGQRCHKPVTLVDIFPTFLQAAGVSSEIAGSGDSLKDIATGAVERVQITGQYHRGENGVYMLATERYKYIYSAPDDKELLFDRLTDPEETRNLANNLVFREMAVELKQALIRFYQSEGYSVPLEGEDWKRYEPKSWPADPDALLLFQDTDASLPNIPGYERNLPRVNQSQLFGFGF